MNDSKIVDSSFTAIVNAPLEKIDIPAWCFNLPDREYHACSPAHVAAGFTTAPDGKRMSINVEIIGGSLIVEHYVETLAQKDHLVLDFDVRCLHADRTNDHSRDMGVERQGARRRKV